MLMATCTMLCTMLWMLMLSYTVAFSPSDRILLRIHPHSTGPVRLMDKKDCGFNDENHKRIGFSRNMRIFEFNSSKNTNSNIDNIDIINTNNNDIHINGNGHKDIHILEENPKQQRRRTFLHQLQLTMAPILLSGFETSKPQAANARGLVKFPCDGPPFLNKYHFMRAGTSLLEEEGVWSTNPLFLTNREAALSQRGMEEVERTCQLLKSEGVAPTIVRYSLAASAIDTSNIVGRELKVGRDKLVPEFNFMDPRAIGSWDMSQFSMTQDAVWAMDDLEAGTDGTGEGSRPPANEDGTPHETLADQKVRLQQLISVLETQYSGDTILLIFPDGTGPALLTCLIGGVPLNRVHEFEFASGEIRLNVNYKSASALKTLTPREAYMDKIANGQLQLRALRDDPDAMTNVKDIAYAKELKLEEEERLKKQAVKEQKEREEALRKEEARVKRDMQKEAERLRREEEKLRREEEKLAKQNGTNGVVEGTSVAVPTSSSTSSTSIRTTNDVEVSTFDPTTASIGVATLVASSFAISLFVEEPEQSVEATVSTNSNSTVVSVSETQEDEIVASNASTSTTATAAAEVQGVTRGNEKPKEEINGSNDTTESTTSTNGIPASLMEKEVKLFDTVALKKNATITTTTNEKDEGKSNQTKSDTEVKGVDSKSTTIGDSSGITLAPPPQAWDPDEDDGGLAWLGSLSEMIAEDDTPIEDEGASFKKVGEGDTWE